MHQVQRGTVELHTRTEMLDLVVKDGRAVGIVTRNLITGAMQSCSAHAVVLCTGGYGNVFYLSTNAKASNVTAAWRAHKQGALFANPCFTQIHPTCIPRSDDFQSKLTLMSESLRNDGRVWVPKQLDDARSPDQIPDDERDYFLERRYPAFGNLVPRDVASRAIKHEVDAGRGVGPQKNGVYLDFAESIERLGDDVIEERYGNLFEMYERITDENPYKVPMRIYPAVHYTMGGLWVDYNLMSNVPGLYVLGEANFSDHGANRLGASALMQGLADGYFVLPSTISDYLAPLLGSQPVPTDDPVFRDAEAARRRPDPAAAVDQRQASRSTTSTASSATSCGTTAAWPAASESLEKALSDIPALREEFYADVRVLGEHETLNQSLEKAGRVADFLEFGELLCLDALTREESCGGHFRVEHQTEDGEALRDDDNFSHVAAWEFDRRRATHRRSTRSRSSSSTSTSPSGATSRRKGLQSPWISSSASGARPAPTHPGAFEEIDATDISPEMSFLEMFDVVNDRLVAEGREPIAFDHDCREGICGSCSMMINGRAHGPSEGTATCQLHMRKFHDGDEIVVEPWRARAFPDHPRPRRRPQRLRPHHRGRRLHHRPDRQRARRQPDPRAEGGRRRRHGRRRLHRVRRVRGRLPERRRPAVHRGEGRAPRPAPPGPARALRARHRTWSRRWRATSARAPTTASARRRARRRSASTSSRS